MKLYENIEIMVRSPDSDTDIFDFVAGVLQGDTLAPFQFIINQDYILWTSIDRMKGNSSYKYTNSSRIYDTQSGANSMWYWSLLNPKQNRVRVS